MSAFSSRPVQPLRQWTQDRLRALAASLDAVLHAWARAWGLAPAAEGTTCAAARPEAGLARADFLGRRGDAAAWLHNREACRDHVHAALFQGASQSGDIAREAARQCEADLLARLRALLVLQEEAACAPPEDAGRRWSGWVMAQLPIGASLLLSAAAVERLEGAAAGTARSRSQGSATPLVPLDQALASSPLRVRVELEGCELGLGVLKDLQAGDVLRVKHRLDAPAIVRGIGGDALFDGYLMRRGNRRALELTTPAAAGERKP